MIHDAPAIIGETEHSLYGVLSSGEPHIDTQRDKVAFAFLGGARLMLFEVLFPKPKPRGAGSSQIVTLLRKSGV